MNTEDYAWEYCKIIGYLRDRAEYDDTYVTIWEPFLGAKNIDALQAAGFTVKPADVAQHTMWVVLDDDMRLDRECVACNLLYSKTRCTHCGELHAQCKCAKREE